MNCLHCGEPIIEGEPFVYSDSLHMECFQRMLIGSVGHQLKKCSCFGGDFEDPPNMTKREAAKAAVYTFQQVRAAKAYINENCQRRLCDKCKKPYRGPAVYCSLECALADA